FFCAVSVLSLLCTLSLHDALPILVLFFFLLYFAYFAFFEIIWNGQTPGKRKAGIRVIKDSGRPLTVPESIARNLLRIVDWLPALDRKSTRLNSSHRTTSYAVFCLK